MHGQNLKCRVKSSQDCCHLDNGWEKLFSHWTPILIPGWGLVDWQIASSKNGNFVKDDSCRFMRWRASRSQRAAINVNSCFITMGKLENNSSWSKNQAIFVIRVCRVVVTLRSQTQNISDPKEIFPCFWVRFWQQDLSNRISFSIWTKKLCMFEILSGFFFILSLFNALPKKFNGHICSSNCLSEREPKV